MKQAKTFPKEIPITGRVRICLELIQKQALNGKTIVDVGCSFGWLEKEIKKLKPRKIVGIEMDPEAIKFAKKEISGVEFYVGDALNLPIENKSADLVALFDVIEHIPTGTESKMLDEVFRILKSSGRVLLSTPNANIIAKLLDPAWYFGHRHYKEETLVKMFKKSGFKVTDIFRRGNLFSCLFIAWFYVVKIIFRIPQPRNELFEKLDDMGYRKEGIKEIFLVAQKQT